MAGVAESTKAAALDTPLVEVEHLTKWFPVSHGILQRTVGHVHAVEDVSFTVARGETLGVVGESGCGKTTMARVLLKLLEPTNGTIRFDGQDITNLDRRRMRPLRREMQMVFQDPYSSLNPRQTVGAIIGAPFSIHKTEGETRAKVVELIDRVGLSPEHYNRYPHEFSGGQRQRIGVARALALAPKLIVCDEPVSALDVSVQAQILNLLLSLQDDYGLTYVFISHDLGVVRHVSDRIAVMYLGRIVEIGTAADIYSSPRHPYTVALLSAVARKAVDGVTRRDRIVLSGRCSIRPRSACSGARFIPAAPRLDWCPVMPTSRRKTVTLRFPSEPRWVRITRSRAGIPFVQERIFVHQFQPPPASGRGKIASPIPLTFALRYRRNEQDGRRAFQPAAGLRTGTRVGFTAC